MTIEPIVGALQLTALAACSVSLWTLRVAIAASGRRLSAAMVAAVEAGLFALAFSAILAALDDPLRIVGYAFGVALGTLVGMVADDHFSTGQSLVRLVVDGDGRAELAALHASGWPATATSSDGVRGAVTILMVVVDDKALRRLRRDIDRHTPYGFETTERLRAVRPTPLPAGMHVTAGARRRRHT